MSLVTTIVAFAVALGSLIVVHELGHFAVARWCGVKVLRFSLGFGRVIASRRVGADATEWVISAFPLGGYVKMLDEREGEVEPGELHRAFNRQGVIRRCLIVVAGPLANFAFAVLLYWLVFMSGVPGMKPVVGAIAPGSPAAQAQFAVGEIITKVGTEPVATWQDARWLLLKGAVAKIQVGIEVQQPNGALGRHVLDFSGLKQAEIEGDFLRVLGFTRIQPPLAPIVGSLTAGAAAAAGLQASDRIVAVNGLAIERWDEVVTLVRANPGRPLALEIERAGRPAGTIVVIPEHVEERGQTIGRIGAVPRIDREKLQGYMIEVRYSAVDAGTRALARTWDTAAFSLKLLGKMVVGEVSLRNLSGPITIADYAGQSAQVGWISYLLFLALISISLGVLNLLPIPLLDGGHLMYYIVEIFKGSPVSEKAMEIGQQIGIAVLFTLMAFALYNDINRLISS